MVTGSFNNSSPLFFVFPSFVMGIILFRSHGEGRVGNEALLEDMLGLTLRIPENKKTLCARNF
jgi:hypothetical protein